jgi:hypothetical protein
MDRGRPAIEDVQQANCKAHEEERQRSESEKRKPAENPD